MHAFARRGDPTMFEVFKFYNKIDHFTIACLVAWPFNESEAGGGLI